MDEAILKQAAELYYSLKDDYNRLKKLGIKTSSDLPAIVSLASMIEREASTPQVTTGQDGQTVVVPEIDLDKLADMVAERLEGELDYDSGNVPYVVVKTNWVFESENLVQETNNILEYLRKELGWEAEGDDDLNFEEGSLDGMKYNYYNFVTYQKEDNILKLSVFGSGNSEDDSDPYIRIMLKEKCPNFEEGMNHFGENKFLNPAKEKLLEVAVALDEKFNGEFDPDDTYDMDSIKVHKKADRFGEK